MHIWPSSSIRESFKFAYLRKLEWNLQRMKREKQQQKQEQSSTSQNLLDNQNSCDSSNADASDSNPDCGFLAFCQDLSTILSCCYCCFCCGVFGSLERTRKSVRLVLGISEKLLSWATSVPIALW